MQSNGIIKASTKCTLAKHRGHFGTKTMKHISILIPEGDVVVNGVAGPLIVFDWVNEVMRERGEPIAYEVDLVGVKPESQLYNGRFAIRPNKMLKDIAQTDLVIVPPDVRRPCWAWCDQLRGHRVGASHACGWRGSGQFVYRSVHVGRHRPC
jgi:hypothetical protein